MPIYYYNCKNCKHAIKVMHPIKEILQDCEECGTPESLIRVPSHFSFAQKEEKKAAAGALVKEKIEEFREELNKEKERLSSEEYDI